MCSGAWSHHNTLACCFVKDEIASGRRMSEFLYAILGGFNSCHCAAPKYTAGFDPENVEIRNHSRPRPDLGHLFFSRYTLCNLSRLTHSSGANFLRAALSAPHSSPHSERDPISASHTATGVTG